MRWWAHETKMRVIGTDQMAGRCYLCPCGWRGWSCWGHARKHHERCPQAQGNPAEQQRTERRNDR